MNIRKKILEYFKGHKYVQLPIIVIVIVLMICIIPRLFVKKPVITNITSASETDVDAHITDSLITIHGENLQNTFAIYINNQWIPQCTILAKDDTHVDVRMPDSYFGEDEVTCVVQVQVKVNSDYFAKSNKQTIYVKRR